MSRPKKTINDQIVKKKKKKKNKNMHGLFVTKILLQEA
jgi:hypothetical protein